MLTFLKNVFKKGELRRKIIFTLGILFVYRLGAGITIPGVNVGSLSSSDATNGIFGIMNLLGGGTLERFSLFALGVSPYITSSIIIELLSMDVIPALTRWRKEGNTGKKKKDRVTRVLTLLLAALQGGVLTYAFDTSYKILVDTSIWSYIYVVLIMMAGSMLAIWLGDQITQKGIGNGVSLLIFTGIVSNLPNAFLTTYDNLVTYDSGMWLDIAWYVLFVVVYLSIVVFVVFTEGAIRKIPVNYASSTSVTMRAREQTHMPIKINSSGVLPVIFASSVMIAPVTIATFITQNDFTRAMQKVLSFQTCTGLAIYVVLILLFTFFYTNLQVDPEKISENLGKSGTYIPGVRPGAETKNYVSKVLNRITVLGSISLAFIAVLPYVIPLVNPAFANTNVGLGGTGIIIVVGVALETVKSLTSQATQKTYRGFIAR